MTSSKSLLAGVPLPAGAQLDLLVPENEFFGGERDASRTSGSLRISHARLALTSRHDGKPDLVILPSSFLSRWGRDLLGVPYTELERVLGIDVALVQCERIIL